MFQHWGKKTKSLHVCSIEPELLKEVARVFGTSNRPAPSKTNYIPVSDVLQECRLSRGVGVRESKAV